MIPKNISLLIISLPNSDQINLRSEQKPNKVKQPIVPYCKTLENHAKIESITRK